MAWIYLDDHFPEHPKIVLAGGDAGWLFVCVMGYCKRHGTGGKIPKSAALRVSDRKNPAALLRRMVEVELLDDAGDFYEVHNYDEWNRPQESRTEAARKAAKARWAKNRPDDASGNANASESHSERMSEPPCEPDAWTCPMPLAPAPTGLTSSGESTVVRPSTALSLLNKTKHASHGGEIDGHVMALVASHGPAAVERAVQTVADQLAGKSFAWPSDVRKALEAELGPAPVEAKPNPLDEAQRAQYGSMLDLAAPPPWVEDDGLTAEERRIKNEERKAARAARRSA